jgi:hypothetical protein
MEIACAIFNDLCDRNGIGDEMDLLEDDVSSEMLDTWCDLIQEIV